MFCLLPWSAGAAPVREQQVSGSQGTGATTQPKPAAPDAAADIGAARALLATGRPQEAIAKLDAVLARNPANRDGVLLKTAALADQLRFEEALSTYDAYVAAVKKPDAGLLAPIARATLRRLPEALPGDPMVVASALEALARAGDAEALRALRGAAASPASSDAAEKLNGSLARLGDAAAGQKLGQMLRAASSPDARTRTIRVIQDADARGAAPAVAERLQDAAPQVRAAAALAVGVLQYVDAVPGLTAIFQGDEPIVRMFAAAALKRLGQTTADGYLAELLRNPTPEVRLVVAEAYQTSKTTQWIPYVKQLLTDRNEAYRFRAAEMLACCDQPAARSVLLPALESPNPAMRGEAARILVDKHLADAKVARRLLGDAIDMNRLRGAEAALQLAAVPSR